MVEEYKEYEIDITKWLKKIIRLVVFVIPKKIIKYCYHLITSKKMWITLAVATLVFATYFIVKNLDQKAPDADKPSTLGIRETALPEGYIEDSDSSQNNEVYSSTNIVAEDAVITVSKQTSVPEEAFINQFKDGLQIQTDLGVAYVLAKSGNTSMAGLQTSSSTYYFRSSAAIPVDEMVKIISATKEE